MGRFQFARHSQQQVFPAKRINLESDGVFLHRRARPNEHMPVRTIDLTNNGQFDAGRLFVEFTEFLRRENFTFDPKAASRS